jgi:hypothetical protein
MNANEEWAGKDEDSSGENYGPKRRDEEGRGE